MIYRGYGGSKGYGAAGASLRKRSTKGFVDMSGSPSEDINLNNYTLRQRGRLMFMGNPIAASAMKTSRTNTIGTGLRLNPRPDAQFLGISPEEAQEWAHKVKREFSLWAQDRRACDALGLNDFYELQQLLFTSWLTSGDVFALVQEGETDTLRPYSLRIRAVEADRVATPSDADSVYMTEARAANGNLIHDGVEVGRSGEVVAYHFRNTYPFESTAEPTRFERVEAVGKETGLPNVIHLMAAERPDQYRGVTFLAPVIIPLLQINRYTESELTAALVESYFTGFIKTEAPPNDVPFNEIGSEGEPDGGVSDYDDDYEMGPGFMNVMRPGESVEFGDPKRPASGFTAFVEAVATQVGAALEIPREVLLKTFTASYSAARGALLEAWKSFKMYRTWFINDFCNPVYELWLSEAVARGRVEARGFFTDPAARAAWLNAQWIGPSQGQLDPTKEISAEILACQNGFSTHADSALRINGSDFDGNIETLEAEMERMKAINGMGTGSMNNQDVNAPDETPGADGNGEIEEQNNGNGEEKKDAGNN